MLSNFEAPAEASLPVTLTGRQKEILQWAALGKSKSVIAGIMGLSENTVDSHFRGIFEKLDCHDRTIAILKAIQLGLIQV
jgi:LuxR family transcriptional regulator/LuxR family quorum-sensing system transcriptional regulator SolR